VLGSLCLTRECGAHLPALQINQGFTFVSETDTEVVPKLLMYLHRQYNGAVSLPKLAMEVMLHLEGAFALLIKSTTFYPGQLVACKRGSPLVYAMGEAGAGAPRTTSNGGAVVEDMVPPEPAASNGAKEVWLASDAAALLCHSRHITVLHDEDLLHIMADGGVATFNLGAVMKKGSSVPELVNQLSALSCVSTLAVSRQARRLSMPLESVMKVRGQARGVGLPRPGGGGGGGAHQEAVWHAVPLLVAVIVAVWLEE
jgi:hypothetical protein